MCADTKLKAWAAAAEAMRRVPGETARLNQTVEHRGEFRRVAMTDHASAEPDDDL
jgi:hypothetical protein